MDQTAELLDEIAAALRWARFGGVKSIHVPGLQPMPQPEQPSTPTTRAGSPHEPRSNGANHRSQRERQPPPRRERTDQGHKRNQPASPPPSKRGGLKPRARLQLDVPAGRARGTSRPQAPAQKAAPTLPIVAFPAGDPAGPLTVICAGKWGDGPGACWEGSDGQLLAKMVAAMKLDPAKVHAVTLVQVPTGQVVPPAERPDPLSTQLKQAQSKVLLIFGERTAQWLLRTDEKIDVLRGKWRRLAGRDVMITYGPELLLQMPMFKAMAWKDMQDVMSRLAR